MINLYIQILSIPIPERCMMRMRLLIIHHRYLSSLLYVLLQLLVSCETLVIVFIFSILKCVW